MQTSQSSGSLACGLIPFFVRVLHVIQRMRAWGALLLVSSMCFGTSSSAAVITYHSSNNGGTNWSYNYTVAATGTGSAIDEFTIYFDPLLYQNLVLQTTPISWDTIVIQPDAGLVASGFLDGLALVAGLAPGAAVSGFSVSFEYLGNGAPGAQPFDIVDPNTFATISQGTTQSAVAEVPEPGAAWLLALPLLFLFLSRTRRGLPGVNPRSAQNAI